MRAWLCVVVAVAACGNGGGTDDPVDGAVDAPADATVPPGWTSLIERNWQLPTNVEDYLCKRMRITEDTWISGFRLLAPPGTHHTLLTISPNAGTLGDYNCDGAASNDMQLLFAGGAGTDDMLFPPGVAIKLPAGTYINLNLHVFNLTDATLAGTSGILIKTMPANEVVHEADMMFLGTFLIDIPPNNQPTVEAGSCSMPAEWNIFNFWPHMHGFAKHQKVMVRRSGGLVETLLDTDYNVLEQRNYPMAPVKMNVNDELQVECTYVNDTIITQPPGYPLTYGESATQEMCFAGFYKWPKGGTLYYCAQL